MPLTRRMISPAVFLTLAGLILCVCGCAPQPGNGDATAGQATFNQRCSGCHAAPDLAGSENIITNDMVTVNVAMAGITLTDTEVANLRAFIAQQ